MNTITITVKDEQYLEPLAEMLNSFDFVASVNVYEEEDTDLTSDEIRMVEDRVAEYRKNPQSSKSWEQIRESVRAKYGF